MGNPERSSGQLSCVALIICDLVIEDVRTHNKTVVGMFNQVGALSFPCIQPRLTILAALTEGRTATSVKLRLNRVENERPLLEVTGSVEFKDPLRVTDFIYELRNVVFPEPGLYAVSIHEGECMLRERRFLVQELQPDK